MAVLKTLADITGVKAACSNLGMPRATYYRMLKPSVNDRMQVKNKHPLALCDEERQAVLDTLYSERFVDKSPGEIVPILLDEGQYLCSERTMYRILLAEDETRIRRQHVKSVSYQKPELLATAPNAVWSRDITKLKGPQTWSYFHLYVILDIFSRYVVGWMVADREAAVLANRLIQQSCEKQCIVPGQLTIHADRGPSMKSKLVAHLLSDLGITKTHSRPYTSDDNPFSEAQFKTLKYCPQFPGRFGCIEDAESFCRAFFRWYNDEHRHSGIQRLTPASVHYQKASQVLENRNIVLRKAFHAHPERFKNQMPSAGNVPTAVWINKPKFNNEGEIAA